MNAVWRQVGRRSLRGIRALLVLVMVAALAVSLSGCSYLGKRQAQKYLEGFGWQVQGQPKVTSVTVPAIEPGTLADAYAELLSDMGSDKPEGGLAALKDSKVTQYVFPLVGGAELMPAPAKGYGVVWILKGKVIAAWTAAVVPAEADSAKTAGVAIDVFQSDLFSVRGRLLEEALLSNGQSPDTLAWLKARRAVAGGGSGAGTGEPVTYLANGQTKTADRRVLEAFEMLRSKKERLPFAWGKVPMYVARYYTADLTGVAGVSSDQWDDILAGSGLNVRIKGETVATYRGGNPGVTSVPLVYTDGNKGYFIELAPLGQDGLFVVSKVNPSISAK